MPRKGPPSATSSQALETAALPTPARLAADTMGRAGSNDALARLNQAMGELKALAVAPMLQRAVNAIRADEPGTATEWAIKALEQDEHNGFGWYLLAIARERAGDFASSVAAYESALKLLPDHAEVANDLGRLAFRMGMREQAEKLFRHFLIRHPDHPEGANNLACAIRDQSRLEEAVEILKPALLKNPEVGMLWNTMGTVVAEQGDFPTARIFFEECLRLEPGLAKARYNLGNALLNLGDPEGALEASNTAIAAVTAEDERQMMRLARSTILIALGRLGDGWEEYEARFHPQFAEITHFLIDRPRWTPGADLTGKSLLVVGEQGLGDEVLFANTLRDVLDRLGPDGRLTLAVEPRLVTLFQRAFPQVDVGAHATYRLGTRPARAAPFVEDMAAIDLWAPIASLLRDFRRTVDDFPVREPLLTADPDRVAYWRAQVAALPGRKVGLLWKSGISKDARHRYFAKFADWAPVLAQAGVTFVNLQYGDCAEELAFAQRELGVEIWQPPGIDLKQDLDDVTALCCAMDLVVGFSNASFNLAAACGAPAWLITVPGSWPRLGTRDRYPWYPQVKVFAPEAYGDWGPVMSEVADALAGFAGAAEH
ncbi:flagellar protein FlbA [Phenylobacterium hankyongense]|uniref:Flagellar protein FlbA n=1 Tax=Phenylobacterium hankyongense TaxID=1813876 RepID=A0A328B364_9CAUL|nr:tetratricopeptide repeat protein [Phenylobacterium hankyongense]RAK61349.1 flagellar protein FlbA [Phenylobacterium hankyongense]